MEKAIFPGTFNPPTIGHLNVIERASKKVNTLCIAVGNNPQKQLAAPIKTRLLWLTKITKHLPNVIVMPFNGLLVDFAATHKVDLVIRSLRSASEVEQEWMLASMNKAMTGLETLFLLSEIPYVSSTLVREVALNGRSVEEFVPKAIAEDVLEYFKK